MVRYGHVVIEKVVAEYVYVRSVAFPEKYYHYLYRMSLLYNNVPSIPWHAQELINDIAIRKSRIPREGTIHIPMRFYGGGMVSIITYNGGIYDHTDSNVTVINATLTKMMLDRQVMFDLSFNITDESLITDIELLDSIHSQVLDMFSYWKYRLANALDETIHLYLNGGIGALQDITSVIQPNESLAVNNINEEEEEIYDVSDI